MKLKDGKLVSVTAVSEGKEVTFQADYVLSSMPVKDLIESIGQNVVPPDVYRNAVELPYRDFIAVGLETDRLKLKTGPDCRRSTTSFRTAGSTFRNRTSGSGVSRYSTTGRLIC